SSIGGHPPPHCSQHPLIDRGQETIARKPEASSHRPLVRFPGLPVKGDMVRAAETRRAVKAALDVATSLGLEADDAVMLQNANKLALRLLPADVMARVSPVDEQDAAMEVELARRLGAAGCPV